MVKTYSTPGPRSIYPEMCQSRSLGRCGLLANALFPRLIAQADDQGRLHGDAQDVAALCFPRMPKVHRGIADALAELAEAKAVICYQDGGEPYLQLVGWWEYQGFQRRAYPSRYPPPDGWEDRVYGLHRPLADDGGDLPHMAESGGTSPHMAGTGNLARAAARAGAVQAIPIQSRPVQAHPAPGARDGLPNLEEHPEVVAAGEAITGRGGMAMGWKQETELDRLVGDHGAAAVIAAMRSLANGKALSWRQLVWGAMKRIEPIPGAETPAEREEAEVQAALRRAEARNAALTAHEEARR